MTASKRPPTKNDQAVYTHTAAVPIVDLVSRKRIATTVNPEATSTQVKIIFTNALDAEGLLDDQIRERLANMDETIPELDDDQVPLVLAVSDNGTEMKSRETRKFMAACSIAQHFARRSTPTDQAWIETLWGHIKAENPHLMNITDPAVLAAELERIRVHYNTVRLHEAIGYVTPDDEHEGRGTPSEPPDEPVLPKPTRPVEPGIAPAGAQHDHPPFDTPDHAHQHHRQPPTTSPPPRTVV